MAIVTTEYIKLVAPDRLLLSETVCHLLGIVIYHPNVQRCQPEEDHPNVQSVERCQPEEDHPNVQSVERCQPEKGNHSGDIGYPIKEELQPSEQPPKLVKQNIVSSTGVRLVNTIRLPANHAAAVPVKIHEIRGTAAMIEADNFIDDCVHIDQSLVEVSEDGSPTLIIVNNGKSPCQLKSNMELATACEAEAELLSDQTQDATSCIELAEAEYNETVGPPFEPFKVCSMNSSSENSGSNEHVQWRQHQLRKAFIGSRKQLSQEEASQLSQLLADYHDIFSLNDDKRGEADLVEFKIDTRDASPMKQAARRIPFAALQEIARQLDEMQNNNIIKPSESQSCGIG